MNNNDLEIQFQKAIEIASKMSQSELAQDVQLRLYAFYKQATFGSVYVQSDNFDLRNAFKTNAWLQISHLTAEEAKKEYISLIDSLTKK